MCPIPLERRSRAARRSSGMFSVAGDSMLFVDKPGRRVVNEKLPYNELAQAFFRWDRWRGEYPHLVLVRSGTSAARTHSASDEYGRLSSPTGRDDAHVIRGETLDELAAGDPRRAERVAARTGGAALDRGLHREPAGQHRALQRLRRTAAWTRTSAAASAPCSSSSTAT